MLFLYVLAYLFFLFHAGIIFAISDIIVGALILCALFVNRLTLRDPVFYSIPVCIGQFFSAMVNAIEDLAFDIANLPFCLIMDKTE